ncbi:MAG: hypothetical protein ACKV19_10325 [Verrucomicrobiales bacterium]
MKRPLRSSEKLLLALCLSLIGGLGLILVIRDHRLRAADARKRIEALQPEAAALDASLADAPFWEERRAWLDQNMPALGDSGESHSRFLEELRTAARDRGLVLGPPVLLKPEATPHFNDLAVTLQITGPDQAVYRWLAELQSPEKFQVVKYLLLTPQSGPVPRMTGTVTVSRLFKP